MFAPELKTWLDSPAPERFPYPAVVGAFHATGKHFVSPELLTLLGTVRDTLPPGPAPRWRTLAAFLDTALDKADGRYDYPTYLALRLLDLPSSNDPAEQAPMARARCDRIMAQLVTDAMAFELAVADGRETRLPKMRPEPGLVSKRLRHGLHALDPVLARMGLAGELAAGPVEDRARQMCALVDADTSTAERRVLELSMLPVYTAHDEYLFLRVLQTFETTFALLAIQLRGAVAALPGGDVEQAVYFVKGAATALHEIAPMFAMLATMQTESFRTFRQFTEGASAIQSRNYKIMESLCRRPGTERIGSAAYHSVPEVRRQVLTGRQVTLDDAYMRALGSGALDDAGRAQLAGAMADFSAAMVHWRTTHYRLAVHMLGDATGTGYTEGTPYLAAVRTIPVFTSTGEAGAPQPGRPRRR